MSPPIDISALVTVDFETFFSPKTGYSLSKVPASEYIRDPKFQVIGVGVQIGNGAPVWLEDASFRDWAAKIDWKHCAVLGHNLAEFDGLILSHHYGINPGFGLDTLCMARALHGTDVGNSLKTLAEKYEIGAKGTEIVQAQEKRRENFTREEWLRYGEYCKNDVTLTRKLFDKLATSPLVNGAFPEDELWLIDTTMRFFTQPSFRADLPRLEAFRQKELESKAALLKRLTEADDEALRGADKSVLMSNDKFALLLTELGQEVPMKVSAKKSKAASEKAGESITVEVPALAKSDPGFQDLLESDVDEVRWLAEARVGVKTTINETRAERLLKAGAGGAPICVALKYYGAHTGRWSGSQKFNFQNLPRDGELRKSLLAPPGYSIVVADSSQIEARMLAWVARHDGLLDIFRKNDAEGGDFYSEVGTSIFGRPISKEKTPLERQLSKAFVLGLGYGMGWYKFALELAKGMLGMPKVVFTRADSERFRVNVPEFAQRQFRGQPSNAERVEEMPSRLPYEDRIVHCAVADYFVRLYRETNPNVPAFWKDIDTVLADLLRDDIDYSFGPGGCLRAQRHRIVLPNGLALRYPGLQRSESGKFSYMGGYRGKQRQFTYGASVTENIVQALARIVVADQMLKARFEIEAMGGWLVTMTHDEVVASIPADVADPTLDLLKGKMKTPPQWCMDLPVSSSGGIGRNYGDIKK